MKIAEILNGEMTAAESISALSTKNIKIPAWETVDGCGLRAEYDPRLHPVNNHAIYPDTVDEDGRREPVTRAALNFQRLAVNRMTELMCGIPVKRVYKAEGDAQQEAAKYLENIFSYVNVDDINIERMKMLFAGCEVITLWFAQEQENSSYGFKTALKLRCRDFTPMRGDMLYPLFDEFGDMIALSIEYRRIVAGKTYAYFDAYTADRHIRWKDSRDGTGWVRAVDETNTLGKIPGVYIWRPEPIWEHTSPIVYEMEWALSRNGNYLRKNSKPVFAVFASDTVEYGQSESEKKTFRDILQLPAEAKADYITWQQATESLKFHIDTLRQMYFSQLQLPDWSYEKMSQQALSGESRKQLFIDARLKVGDESGAWRKFFDREVNVVKAYLKIMVPRLADAIDALTVKNIITPFSINDEKETAERLTTANGNKAIMSQRESIEEYGHSADVDKTLREIREEEEIAAGNLTV